MQTRSWLAFIYRFAPSDLRSPAALDTGVNSFLSSRVLLNLDVVNETGVCKKRDGPRSCAFGAYDTPSFQGNDV